MSNDGEKLDAALMRLLAARGPDKSICPSEAARAVDPDNWRRLMKAVKARALVLEAAGRLVFRRKGKVVAGDAVRGVYRLSQPPEHS